MLQRVEKIANFIRSKHLEVGILLLNQKASQLEYGGVNGEVGAVEFREKREEVVAALRSGTAAILRVR